VSTIEQAAKRLEQLRQAGVEIADQAPATAAAPAAEPLPLRVARELEARGTSAPVHERLLERIQPPVPEAGVAAASPEFAVVHAEAPPMRARTVATPPVATPGTSQVAAPESPRVEIDLGRLSANGYITPNAPRSRLAEEFRVIKRPLLMNARGKSASPVKNATRIMVTSALAGEGKTYVSLNLAMSLAQEVDTSVLLVDADASRPAVLTRLGLPPSKGLLDLLVDSSLTLESVVLPTNVDRLWILPAGTPQPHATELLASDAMSRLVEQLSSSVAGRVVLFDTPPLLAASESRVLAAHMGQVILVISADDTPQGSVTDALASVENCPVVVTLLNKAAPGDTGNYYGSYGS